MLHKKVSIPVRIIQNNSPTIHPFTPGNSGLFIDLQRLLI